MPINYRNGVPGLFTDIGKTLTATSLGLQGKDPSGVFEEEGANINDILTKAQLFQMSSNPELAEKLVNKELGINPIISQESSKVIKDVDTAKSLEGADSQVKKPKFTATETKLGNVKLKNFDAELNQRLNEKAGDESFKQTADFIQADTSFRKVANLFSGVVGRQKAKGVAQKGIIQDLREKSGLPIPSSDDGLGLVEGAIGGFFANIKDERAAPVAALDGQVTETVFALNSILTGQNRVIKGITEQIKGTISGGFEPSTFIADKTAQSITNAFRLRKALKEAQLTPDKLRKMPESEFNKLEAGELIESVTLTSDEKEVLEILIGEILATPPAESRDLPKSKRGKKREDISVDDLQNLSMEELKEFAK